MQNNSQKYCHLLDLRAPSSFQSSESVVRICYTRELFLKVYQSSQEDTCTEFSFRYSATFLKRDSSTGIFM